MDDDVMIAHSWNGAPLTLEHGGKTGRELKAEGK
jgi:DMSO/TMAO reductase YedYZ molybdopterin-dependent catalytic subunit